MLYRRRRANSSLPSGFFRFASGGRVVSGPGDGDFIRLRDQFGNEWLGVAERQQDDSIRYRFRDAKGQYVTGISDGYGIILRDAKGNTWRGYID
jgi:hypothetical protein